MTRGAERLRQLVSERRALGLCPTCGLRPPAPGWKQCDLCRQKRRAYMLKYSRTRPGFNQQKYAKAKAKPEQIARMREAADRWHRTPFGRRMACRNVFISRLRKQAGGELSPDLLQWARELWEARELLRNRGEGSNGRRKDQIR